MDESEVGAQTTPRVIVREGYMKRRARVEFEGDYAGAWVDVWINFPKRLANKLAHDDTAVSDKATADFIVAHNLQYPVDQERPDDAPDDWTPAFRAGDPMPATMTAEAVSYIPVDLYRKVIELGMEALQEASKVSKSR